MVDGGADIRWVFEGHTMEGCVMGVVTGDCNESKVNAGSSAPAASHASSHLSCLSILQEHAAAFLPQRNGPTQRHHSTITTAFQSFTQQPPIRR